MLELRPTCEHCNKALPPAATEARICSFECTFCEACAVGLLSNVCPNCGGGFAPRPVRPAHDRKNGNYLGDYPASGAPKHRPVDLEAHRRFVETLGHIPAENR